MMIIIGHEQETVSYPRLLWHHLDYNYTVLLLSYNLYSPAYCILLFSSSTQIIMSRNNYNVYGTTQSKLSRTICLLKNLKATLIKLVGIMWLGGNNVVATISIIISFSFPPVFIFWLFDYFVILALFQLYLLLLIQFSICTKQEIEL